MHPLAGVRVVECGVAIAGPLAARYLAQLGAEVIKVESRGTGMGAIAGGPAWAPKDLGPAAADLSGANNTFNSGKSSLALDLKHPRGREMFDRVIAKSDIFVTNFSIPAIESLGIAYEQLRAVNPGLVYASMPGFGSADGPYRSYRSWGPNLSALSGLDSLTGDPDRPPVLTPVPLIDYVAGYQSVVAIISALMHREATGVGQAIDVSQFEAAVAVLGPYVGEVTGPGNMSLRRGNRKTDASPSDVFACRGEDRWVAIVIRNDAEWRALGEVAGGPPWSRDDRFGTLAGRLAHEDEVQAAIESWTRQCTPREVAFRLQARGVPAAPVYDGWDPITDAQLEARRHWRVVTHDRLGVDLINAPPFHFSGTPVRVERAAASYGAGTERVLRELAGLSAEELAALVESGAAATMAPMPESAGTLQRPHWPWSTALTHASMEGDPTPDAPPDEAVGAGSPRHPGGGPLAGYRVVDMSDPLGAYGTRLLAGLGATVTRVVTPAGSALARYAPHWDGSSLFELYMDDGKARVTLDLETAEGRSELERLVGECDVLYDGNPPGYLALRGFDWERLRALNPAIVVVAVTPFGQTGPYRDWAAEDLTLWALSGMLQLTGYPDRRPLIPGGRFSHYFVGANGAVAAVAALRARTVTGHGQRVDVSAHEVLAFTGGATLTQIEDMAPRRRTGSRAIGAAPWGYFTCSDRLVCLLALFPDHWDALAAWIAEETGSDEALDERFRGAPSVRYQQIEDVERLINSLAIRHPADAFCVQAQARGIPATPVNTLADTVADPHLAAVDYWREVAVSGRGTVTWPGPPYRLSETPAVDGAG